MVKQKQASPIWETPALYYNIYVREGYLLSDCLSLLPG